MTFTRSVTHLVLIAIVAMFAPMQAHSNDILAPVITPQELDAIRGKPGLIVLDIRSRASWGYDRGHIEGAVSSPYYEWRGGADHWSSALDTDRLTNIFRAAGITEDSSVVIVHSGMNRRSFSSAAWVFWVLKSAGLSQLAILEGGAKGWREANLPETDVEPEVTPSPITVRLSDAHQATLEDVRAVISGAEEGRLLDSESQVLLDTRVSDRSTLSDAAYLDSFSLFDTDGATVGELYLVLEKLKYSPLDWEYTPVIMFSETLPLAALNWFMASEVSGIKNVKLLTAPFEEWSNISELRKEAQ